MAAPYPFLLFMMVMTLLLGKNSQIACDMQTRPLECIHKSTDDDSCCYYFDEGIETHHIFRIWPAFNYYKKFHKFLK